MAGRFGGVPTRLQSVMNFFTHGRHFLDRPYFLAGTAIPDWLSVVDRKVRARTKYAKPFLDDPNPDVAELAGGIIQHHIDDRWFHSSQAFTTLNLEFTVRIRDWQTDDIGMRPMFLGHILVELLLDDYLIQQDPSKLDQYYASVAKVDPKLIAATITRMTGKPVDLLPVLLPRFLHERFLYDYADDAKLTMRLNQVMKRVKLPSLPTSFEELLPQARRDVAENGECAVGGPET